MNSETKTCQNCKKDFIIEPDDFSFYEKMKVPPPTFCPECRMQRRMSHRNETFLYKNVCGLCHKNTISIYNNDSLIKNIYCPECWWSDKWDPMDFGKDYDFSVNFFKQYFKFKKNVPHESVYHTNFVNSEYCNFGHSFKNCYLVFGGYRNENAFYSTAIGDVKDSANLTLSLNLEFSYECINCFRSSYLKFCSNCEDSSDLTFCIDCRGCVSCIGCVGLRNKQYCIFNEQYTKEEFNSIKKEIDISNYSNFKDIQEKFEKFKVQNIFKENRNINVVDVIGEDIQNSKNCKHCFWGSNLENIKNSFFVVNSRNSQDISFLGSVLGISENLYEVMSSFGGNYQIVGIRTVGDMNCFYSEDCHNCSNIFGCIGLKKKNYCIFNKQYTKDEYEKLLPKIIDHIKAVPFIDKKNRVYTYGDFWPTEMSPFGYNETKAMEYFSLNENEISEKGFNYFNKESNKYIPNILNEDISQLLEEVSDDIVNEIIECAHKDCNHNCSGVFKLITDELRIIKTLNIPLPRLCSNCRYYERLKYQNSLSVWHRQCMCELSNHDHSGQCEVEFETTYAPDRPEIVYCEKCYQKEVL